MPQGDKVEVDKDEFDLAKELSAAEERSMDRLINSAKNAKKGRDAQGERKE